ncbi:MAG: AraC family transcriptional regulator, partial [Pseudomonadota bacterium]
MQANTAKRDPIPVSLIVYDGVKLLDVTGPLQVFSDARFRDGSSAYRVDLVSVAGGPVATDTVMRIDTCRTADAPKADTALVIGGRRALTARHDADLQALTRTISRTARRFCSVCLGAFVLAEAGLLDGRRAATHWSECDRLAGDYPGVDVMEDEIFVKDGNIWTSAGVTAGIDMSLALVEADLGREEALRIARSLVLPMKR